MSAGQWTRSRTDIQSYDADGDPVVFLYPPDESQERIGIRGDDCQATAARLLAVLNAPAAPKTELREPGHHVMVILGDGEVAVSVMKNPWSLTFHPTSKPYPVGTLMTEAEERIQDARETVVIRVKSLEAANVLLECAAKLVGALSVEAAEPPSPSEGEGPNPIPSEGEGKEGDDHG